MKRSIINQALLHGVLPVTVMLVAAACSAPEQPKSTAAMKGTDKAAISRQPGWYLTLPYKNYELIGYGSGDNQEAARQRARAAIAQTLRVSIVSDLRTTTRLENDVLLEESYAYLIQSRTAMDLAGVRIVKEARDGSGTWYAAALYDQRPLALKVAGEMNGVRETDVQANYWTASPLMQKIAQRLGAVPRCQLLGSTVGYTLECSDRFFPLASADLRDLLYDYSDEGLHFKTGQSVYMPGDVLTFFLEASPVGYATIFVVEEDGKTAILERNVPLKEPQKWPQGDESFIVVNPYKRTLAELYVMLLSPLPIEKGSFERVEAEQLDDTALKFDRLLTMMRRYPAACVRIKILPYGSE